MPGIFGIIGPVPRQQAEVDLARMGKAMCHETSYRHGTFVSEEHQVYAGWVARDRSFDSAMPVVSAGGRVTLIFSGEEYSGPMPAAEAWPGDASALNPVSAIANQYRDDPDFPANLNGRFHGLLLDAASGSGLLWNDRYGMHRLYVHERAGAIYFAAEAKALLAVFPELRALDDTALGEFITCGCALRNRSLFKDISLLPPASAWKFKRGVVEKKSLYFKPEDWERQEALSPEAYYSKLRDVFSERVRKYLNGSLPVALSLTGGLDSRMVIAWNKDAADSLPCYSFGGMYRDCADVAIARRVASLCRQPYSVIELGSEFLSRFAHYAERSVYLTDGCVDVSHSPDLYANEHASQLAPVRLTGNYGGEVFRRVRAFKPMPLTPGVWAPELVRKTEEARETFASVIDRHPLSFALFCQAPWHHHSLLSLEQTQVTLRSPFLDNEIVKTVYQAPASVLTSNDVSLRLIHDGKAELAAVPTDRGLKYLDSGAAARLRNQLIEFTVKAEYAYDYGMPQWLTRMDRSLSALHLERLFLGRHKFYHFRYWYRTDLRNYVRETLLDSRTLSRPYWNASAIRRIVDEHTNGRGNHTLAIHKLLTLELLHRRLLANG